MGCFDKVYLYIVTPFSNRNVLQVPEVGWRCDLGLVVWSMADLDCNVVKYSSPLYILVSWSVSLCNSSHHLLSVQKYNSV